VSAERSERDGPRQERGPRPATPARPDATLRALAETALVGLARCGSRIAWDELARRFGRLLAAACRYGLSATDAADVAQAR
jgi:hypothetical protein